MAAAVIRSETMVLLLLVLYLFRARACVWVCVRATEKRDFVLITRYALLKTLC